MTGSMGGAMTPSVGGSVGGSVAFGWRDRILVVGSGPAGMAAADELRRLGFTGDLTVLGDEAPYDRPACSKGCCPGIRSCAMCNWPPRKRRWTCGWAVGRCCWTPTTGSSSPTTTRSTATYYSRGFTLSRRPCWMSSHRFRVRGYEQ